jgi:hypothetical protein
MRILRGRLLVALAGLLAASLVACGGEEGEGDAASRQAVKTLKGEGFSVRMPGSPKRQVITAQTAAGAVPITAYITEGGEEGFSMSVVTVPEGVRGDLDRAVQGAAESVKGKLRTTTKIRHQGFPGRDARIADAADANGNKGTVFARVILAKGRVFQLQYVTGGADVKAAPAAYRSFVSSLKIG